MASTDAKPFPIKNTAYRVTFPILDADGDLVAGAAGLDSEVSKDGGTFTDCTNEATQIATSSGMYYLDLTATEMNADTVAIIVKTSTSGAKTTPIVMYPVENTDIPVNIKAISDDTTAPDNLELMYDGTGYAGGTTKLEIDIVKLLGTAWLTPGVAGTPDVNTKLLGGTVQTGNDNGADINAILTDTGTTLDALIKDVPTVAEFEARSIVAANYVVVGDTIAGVTAVTNDVGITQAGADKVWGTAARALTDKAGFALSSAAITAIFNKDISAYSGAGYAGAYLKNLYDNQGNWITATGFATSGALATAQSDLDIITGASGVVIQDGTIIAASLGADCITNAKIADNAIAVENIKDSAISAAKIATDAITATKIAANAIGSSEFAQAAADKVRASVCVTGDPANSIGKILHEIYTNRLTSARAGYLANINNANLATIADISTLTATEIAYLNASISSRSSHAAAAIWSVGTRALTDKAGFALSTAGILAIWHQLTANIVTANTIGKLLKDDINATISSRSSHAAVDIWSVGTRALTDKAGFSLAAAAITAIWEKNISAFSGVGYAGTYVKTLYDDWINAGRLDAILDLIAADVVNIDGDAMRGTDSANTTTPPTVNAIADQVWDEALTGAVHNIATSAGRRLRQAADVMIIREETCQAGGGNDEIILDSGASAVNDFYKNNLVVLTSGTGVGEQRHIDSYVGSSKTATVNRDWTTNPDATTNFVIKADSTKHVHGFETAAKAEIESEANDALVALKLDHLIAVADSDDPVNNSIIAMLAATDGDWSKFAKGTDALQAIRDRGDSAWITGAGGDATTANQTTIINHLTDVKGTNFVKDTHSLKQILDLIQRTLGLTQENHYIDNPTFTSGKLTAARIRIYSVAGSVGTAADVIATYNIATTYDVDGNMETYKVTKA